MPTDCFATTACGSWTWRAELGVDAPGRPETAGSNGPSVADVDGDGHLDLFVAGYGGNFLYRNLGRGRFVEAAAEYGVQGGDKATPSRWGDYDNDGRPDLYVSSYVDQPIKERDFLFHRESGGRFVDVLPTLKLPKGATHGVQWVDFDNDGDLDLSLTNNNPTGAHPLYRNLLDPARARQSVEVRVVDDRGRDTRAGSEVRVYAAGTRRLLGAGLVDTGSGYCSQNVMPVHIGLGSVDACGHRSDVDVEDAPRRDAAGGRYTGSGRVDGSYAGIPLECRSAAALFPESESRAFSLVAVGLCHYDRLT